MSTASIVVGMRLLSTGLLGNLIAKELDKVTLSAKNGGSLRSSP
jgi:hypothetical protein